MANHGRLFNVPKWSKKVQKGPKWSIVWACVRLASPGSNAPAEVLSTISYVFFFLFWIKNWLSLSVFSTIWAPFGPIWTLLDRFRQNWFFLPQMDKIGFCRGASEQIINSCLKWSQKGPKCSRRLRLTILVPFGLLWNTLERWQACHVWPFLVQNGPFLGHPQSWTVDPKVKKASWPGSLLGLLVDP